MQILRSGFSAIIKDLFRSTVFIYDDKSSGTGFFSEGEFNGKVYRFLITAKHVFFNKNEVSIKINDYNYKLTLVDKDKNPIWFTNWDLRQEIDVAILPIDYFLVANRITNLLFFDLSTFADKDMILKEEISPGSDILFAGYPLGINKNNHPVLRTGTIATPPEEKIENKPYFFVDAQFFPGSSGSPVFWPINEIRVNTQTGRIERRADLAQNAPFLLLGVGTAFLQHSGKIEGAPYGTFYNENSGLGMVYNAQTIKNLIFQHMINQDGLEKPKQIEAK